MEKPGAFLKRERELRSIDLKDISKSTKIPLRMLEALENDDFDTLPEIPFVKGYIQAFSKDIGLDSSDVLLCLEAHLREVNQAELEDEESDKSTYLEEKSKREEFDNMQNMAVRLLAVFGVAIMIIYIVMSDDDNSSVKKKTFIANDTIDTISSVTTTTGEGDLDSSAVTVTLNAPVTVVKTKTTVSPDTVIVKTTPVKVKPKKKPIVTATAKKYSLELKALDDVSFSIVADFGAAKEIVLNKGQVRKFTADKGFKLTIADAGALNVTYNGSDLGLLGDEGEEFAISLPMNQ